MRGTTFFHNHFTVIALISSVTLVNETLCDNG